MLLVGIFLLGQVITVWVSCSAIGLCGSSGVCGLSASLPLPNMFRFISVAPYIAPSNTLRLGSLSRFHEDGVGNVERPDCLWHVVNSDHVGPLTNCKHSSSQGAFEPFSRRHPRDPANEGFARHSNHNRLTNALELSQPGKDLKVVIQILAEADSGVYHDFAGTDSCSLSCGHPIFQECGYVFHNILVTRPYLDRKSTRLNS